MLKWIKINRISKPLESEREARVRWLCASLGISPSLEREGALTKIFEEIIKSTLQNKPLKTKELVEKFNLSLAAINYNLRILEDLGLIEREKRIIRLRERSLSQTLEAIKKDIDRLITEMIEEAKEIEKEILFNQ